jgi:hypothetical protein
MVTVFVGVVLASLLGVVRGMDMVAMSYVGVVPGLLVVPRLVMFCSRPMMLRRVFMVFSCLTVMFRTLLRHGSDLRQIVLSFL